MGEQQVTVEGTTRKLGTPFMVLATQNLIEYEGTFPLPEAQLDRFFMRISLGYPDADQEVAIMERREHVDPIDELEPVCTPEDIANLQARADDVYIDVLVKQYIVELANATRQHPEALLVRGFRSPLHSCERQCSADLSSVGVRPGVDLDRLAADSACLAYLHSIRINEEAHFDPGAPQSRNSAFQ